MQLSQLIELGGKREARIAAGTAEVESARYQRLALRLEIASETAIGVPHRAGRAAPRADL